MRERNRITPGSPAEAGGVGGLMRRTPGIAVLVTLGVCLALLHPLDALGLDRVRAELGKETAWTGEPVPLIITLYSPGPFSGTASFDLPELPTTVFVRAGNPLVGSERIDGESYFTQRHEFAIYTQRAETVVIPAFRVRFSGKKSFTSAAEPMEGFTPELRFRSARPPGTEHLGVVVAARRLDASQTWQPAMTGSLRAGDVIVRTVVRRVAGATAMLLPPIEGETPAGVRHYTTDPVVQDFTERGESLGVRSETIKYQFERPGTFQLPDLAVTWWDADARALKRVTLPGKAVDVQADLEAVLEEPLAAAEPRWPVAVVLLALGLVAGLLRKPVTRWWDARRSRNNDPETVAARRLLAACRSDAAAEAYAAGLQWKRAVGRVGQYVEEGLPTGVADDFERGWRLLSRHIYGGGDVGLSWEGKPLAKVFTELRLALGRSSRSRNANEGLRSLNPTHPMAPGSD